MHDIDQGGYYTFDDKVYDTLKSELVAKRFTGKMKRAWEQPASLLYKNCISQVWEQFYRAPPSQRRSIVGTFWVAVGRTKKGAGILRSPKISVRLFAVAAWSRLREILFLGSRQKPSATGFLLVSFRSQFIKLATCMTRLSDRYTMPRALWNTESHLLYFFSTIG